MFHRRGAEGAEKENQRKEKSEELNTELMNSRKN
jgi:hypothetical protein